MGTMSDMFVRGKLFDGQTGLKSGAELEDLATRAYPTVASQLVDQTSLATYSDAAVTDDDGTAINRLQVKDGGITHAKLADDCVEGHNIKDGTITAADLAPGAITAAKIALVPLFHAAAAVYQWLLVSAWTKVTLGTEVVDSHSYFAASRFTPLTAGYYVFTGYVDISAVFTNGMLIAAIYKNGAMAAYARNFGTASANALIGVSVMSPPLAANGTTDYFELYAYQDEYPTMPITGGSYFGGWFVCGAA